MSDIVWPTVRVDGDLARARVEWVHGNGAGAYASSSVAQLHTRRHHGLLVAALEPPRRRHVVLSHVDASVTVDGTSVGLATHQFPSVPPTGGHRYLARFAQDPLPHWFYAVGNGQLEETLALARGQNVVILRYVWRGRRPALLELRPLLAMRAFHELVREHGAMIQRVEMRQHEVSVQPVPSLPRVVFRHRGIFVGSPDWWRRFEYLADRARGVDFQEDLWTPGVFRLNLNPDQPVHLMCEVGAPATMDPESLMRESAEALMACDPGPERGWPVRCLLVAADLFRADRAEPPGIIAGYPWFELWGRHTLISLPGLYLVPGKLEEAKRVLAALIERMRDGLVPNRLPDDGRPDEYHAVDATLMLFSTAKRLGDRLDPSDPFLRAPLLPALVDAFEALMRGTVDGIRVTEDGLLAAGGFGTSLTWMDARVDDRPVTSRAGLPVEIQGLWTRGCDDLGTLAKRVGDEALAARAWEARDRGRAAFRQRFWCEATGFPYDVISADTEDEWVDPTIRPNAIVALAADPALFDRHQAEAIIVRAERDLVTPGGIRTLAPDDPDFQGRYTGSIADRDGATHQGTAWPFLMGAFATAMHQTFPDDMGRAGRLRAHLEAMIGNNLALGQLPELADGDPPHRPDGCVAQAASVSEILRVFVDELKM